MSHLSVRSSTQSDANPFAQPVVLDFSSDVGQGEQILAYAVAIAGFVLNYETNSALWAEDAGRAAITLIPNLVGTALHVDCNLVLTDYDGDSAQGPGKSPSDPGSVVQVTGIALIGTSNPNNEVVLGTAYGLPSGQDSNQISIGSNTQNQAFLSGFSIQGLNGNTSSIGGFSVSVSASSPTEDATKLKGTVSMADFSTTGTVDVGLLSTAPGFPGYQVQQASVSWGEPDGENGMTGLYQASFDVPSGQSIVQVAPILQAVNIVYGGQSDFQMIRAYNPVPLVVDGPNVKGSMNLNIYDPDFLAHQYISSSSTATIFLIAQFG